VGSEAGMEAELVKREGVPYASIPAAGLHGVGLAQLPRNLVTLARGLQAARKHVGAFRPDVLMLTGGYLAGPMAVAARGVPTLLFVPDIEPGLALGLLARFANRIAVSAAESQRYFSKKVVVTGYPVRPELGRWTRSHGLAALKLSPDLPVLLVAGGSKGARSINQAVLAQLPELLKLAQVVHVTGRGDWDSVVTATRNLTKPQMRRYRPFAYLHEEMGAALAAAAVAVMRAGASTLGELPLFGLPAVLVPYPHAWRYQRVNAEHLTRRNAALMLRDEDLGTGLLPLVAGLLKDKRQRASMRKSLKAMARPKAAQALAGQLLELGGLRP
jgi:UDP-N-acetylglucosamine--N-acetylmuramyl-(pentapeptide) pyrophosphoryl-undecaprenol N-acetylglucosamine transferase